MARQVYSVQLSAGHAGSVKDFNTPDGFVTVIRWLTAFNAGALAGETVHVFEDVTSITIYQQTIPPVTSLVQEFRVVWPAGFSIRLDNDPDIDYTLSGYLLSV